MVLTHFTGIHLCFLRRKQQERHNNEINHDRRPLAKMLIITVGKSLTLKKGTLLANESQLRDGELPNQSSSSPKSPFCMQKIIGAGIEGGAGPDSNRCE